MHPLTFAPLRLCFSCNVASLQLHAQEQSASWLQGSNHCAQAIICINVCGPSWGAGASSSAAQELRWLTELSPVQANHLVGNRQCSGIWCLQSEKGDMSLYSVYVPTNHIYVGDVFLMGEVDIIKPNLSVREGLGKQFPLPAVLSWPPLVCAFTVCLPVNSVICMACAHHCHLQEVALCT